ncbi:MAG: hypothetical protein ACK4UO_11685 [Pseudolabrys sp.]
MFIEVVPWMMLSAAVRVLVVHGGLTALVVIQLSDLFLFIAFLLAARRMIEFTGGVTVLGQLSLSQQVALARKVLPRVVAVMVGGAAAVYALGAPWVGLHMLLGFDGIAYDMQTLDGFLWSAFMAAFTLLMVVRVEQHGDARILAVFRELWARIAWMAPAIAVVFLAAIALSILQGAARGVVFAFWTSDAAPSLIRALAFYGFVFVFASVRLWVTLAILVFALRESHRRGAPTPAPTVTPT